MNNRKRLALLILNMTTVSLIVAGIGIYMLYRTALKQQQQRLVETAQNQARLIEAIASTTQSPQITLTTIVDAHRYHNGFGDTGEFTFGKRQGDKIVYLLSDGHYELENPKSIPWNGKLGEPMRRAVSGKSGTLIGLNYRGETVLAAHEPVIGLNWGVVAQMNLAELQAPFFKAALFTGAASILVVLAGVALFLRITNPLFKKLEESEAQTRSILETAAEGIITVSDSGKIEWFNTAAEQIFGYRAAEVVGQNIKKLMSPPQRVQQDGYLTTYLNAGEHLMVKSGSGVEGVRQDGTIFPMELAISKVPQGDRQIFTIIVRDITERVRAQKALQQFETQLRQQAAQLQKTLDELQRAQIQLVQTEKMSSLGQLVAGVAHEINNPVNFIYGNLVHAGKYSQELLRLLYLYQQHYPEPPDEIQTSLEAFDLNFVSEDLPKLLNSMNVGANRIRQIVLTLRNFSRLDEADMKLVDIHEGLDNSLLILQNRLKPKTNHPGIEVIKNYGNLPSIECYPGQLNQVFMNLLTNAIDAIEESRNDSGQISIRTCVQAAEVVQIAIADNGPGIPKEVRNRLFDPFFTTKPVGKGTGLGLSISYQIVVEKHNGQISCFSEPGSGTQFLIEIPLRQHATPQPALNGFKA